MNFYKIKILTFLSVLMLMAPALQAQEPAKHSSSSHSAEKSAPKPPPTAWTLVYPLGLHEAAPVDTALYNYQRQAVPSLVSPAWATTGNLGGEGMEMIFFRRRPRMEFFFADAVREWMPTQQRQKFFNTFIPITQLSYNAGGNKQTAQDRLRATFAGNVNRRIGVGAMVDYLYSKGSYQNQAVKDFSFGVSGYYRGDRYEMQAFYNHWNLLNKENGGITDPLYITDPAVLQGGVDHIDSKSIPVNLQNAHSRVSGQQFFLNNAYNVGYWRTEEVNDTLTRDVYVPVTKFIWTLDFTSGRHRFVDSDDSGAADFWANRYFSARSTYDNTYYSDFSNTLGVQMIEGFRKWAKFGLAVYADYHLQHFSQTPDTLDRTLPLPEELTPLPDGFAIRDKHSRSLLYAGAQLTKQKGSILTYAVDARLGLLGDVAGDIDISGRMDTRFRMLGDTVGFGVRGHFRNTAQPYLLQHYRSNHFVWDNDFGKTRSFRAEGELTVPWTLTTLSAGFENLQNHVYFAADGLPVQNGGSVQVISATLKQKLRFGIWNWDNTIVWQHSSDRDVLPLPALSLYSNMYLWFKAFKVLQVQLGLDCNYYTGYYAPSYQPATMSFTNQREVKIGNYPFMDLYLTCKLSKVRFYVMMSHINQGLFSKDYFSLPLYPLNPRRFQLGLSIDFTN